MENNVVPLESELDRELALIRDGWKLFEPAKPEVRERVLHWLTARCFEHSMRPRPPKNFGVLPGDVL